MTSYLLSGPTGEPVSLDEARAFLRVDGTDEDGLIATLITAARLHVEGVTGRALLTQAWRVVLDRLPECGVVALPVAPCASLTAITAYDAAGEPTSLDLDAIQLSADPAQVLLPAGYGMPIALRQRQGIELDYVAGFGDDPADVPAALRQTLLLLVGYWFENRDSVVIAGSGSIIPAGFDLMVAPYRAVRL